MGDFQMYWHDTYHISTSAPLAPRNKSAQESALSRTATAGPAPANSLLCPQVHVRLQVDLFLRSGGIVEDIELYNTDSTQKYAIDVVFTPKWRTPSDLMYTSVSVPADVRFTDLTGTGSESIAPAGPSNPSGQPWFVFYRRDVFAAAEIAHPETMDDILSAARQLNGSDFNGDGVPDYSVCFNTYPGCVDSYFTFMGILGPMLQTAPSQGVFFQPDTMEPLVQNAAMNEALRMYANLSSYNCPRPDQTCNELPSQFSAGQCPRLVSATLYVVICCDTWWTAQER
jgi:hypothetical protein